jgi:hypothetical protein
LATGALVLTLGATAAVGAVDPNGPWVVHVVPSLFASPFDCQVTVTQSGTSFSVLMGAECSRERRASLVELRVDVIRATPRFSGGG